MAVVTHSCHRSFHTSYESLLVCVASASQGDRCLLHVITQRQSSRSILPSFCDSSPNTFVKGPVSVSREDVSHVVHSDPNYR